jgi:hypothetical protein
VRDHWLMTVTGAKLERPAIFGDFALSVDDIFRPSRVSACRVVERDATFEELATRTYAELRGVDDLLEWLVATIALWLGHASIKSTDVYLHADLTTKEEALRRMAPTPVA